MKSRWRRFQEWLASSDGGSRVIQLFAPLDPLVFKLTGGRITAGGPIVMPHLMLATTGRKSGRKRELMLVYTEIDGDVFVVASNFGKENHPAWSYNLDADPSATMQIGGEARDVKAVRLDQEGVDRIWDRLVDNIPMYRIYRTKTDRQIKVYRLDPR